MKNFLIICAIAIGFMACEKQAGEGGTSVIEGQVYKIHTLFNDTTGEIEDTLYYQLDPGVDVFIIYSNNEGDVYDDKFETDYNGRYRFEYLRKGDYTIYTYADSLQSYDATIPLDDHIEYDYPIFKHIKISSNNSTNKVTDFVIEKNQ
jgi:hypothetical protein